MTRSLLTAVVVGLFVLLSTQSTRALKCYCDTDRGPTPCLNSSCEMDSRNISVGRLGREKEIPVCGLVRFPTHDYFACSAVAQGQSGKRCVAERLRSGVMVERCWCDTGDYCNREWLSDDEDDEDEDDSGPSTLSRLNGSTASDTLATPLTSTSTAGSTTPKVINLDAVTANRARDNHSTSGHDGSTVDLGPTANRPQPNSVETRPRLDAALGGQGSLGQFHFSDASAGTNFSNASKRENAFVNDFHATLAATTEIPEDYDIRDYDELKKSTVEGDDYQINQDPETRASTASIGMAPTTTSTVASTPEIMQTKDDQLNLTASLRMDYAQPVLTKVSYRGAAIDCKHGDCVRDSKSGPSSANNSNTIFSNHVFLCWLLTYAFGIPALTALRNC